MTALTSASLRKAAYAKGADLFGVASVESFLSHPEEKRPERLLPEAKSVIVVGVRVLRDTVKTNLLLSALHHITLNIAHNQIAYDVGRLLDDEGFRAVVVPHRIGNLDPELRKSGDYMNIYPKLFTISTRHAAVEAGIGILGKSRLLLTPQFGPLQRLATIITDAELEPDRKISDEEAKKICPPDCQLCAKACPGQAITPDGFRWEKCNEVIKPHNGQYGYSACCECMISCPAGRRKARSGKG